MCPVDRFLEQLLIDQVVLGVRSVPSGRIADDKRLRGVIPHSRSHRIIGVVPYAS
jgi:hypothetical protein